MTSSNPDDTARQAEILAARAALAATVDELTTRLTPKNLAADAAESTRRAADDAGTFLAGGGFPVGSPSRTRNVKILLGAAAGVALLVTVAVIRSRR
ncbi:DUF3618 domain-containing protein [Sanguibacter suaedae]|uniref:DUF3618 domain-containing protein n=1 Tax=Sanguibacter suaedae TaxID=2795737 RepID=A0A934I7Q7_9MICO|nr:DUF3618 domain-containing protein [Sanguibacter suaedae]MBI9115771.1 DUF3618 domain-containing protein [Sanguibacter suaedae]